MSVPGLSDRDVAYIRRDFVTIEELCSGRRDGPGPVHELIARRRLPAASYLLADGTEMFPPDYFVFADQAGGSDRLREQFDRRYRQAGGVLAERDEDWADYISGIYGVCLRSLLPETIVRKAQLVATITPLLERPRGDVEWRRQLRRAVCELDSLERDFSPDYDRGARFDRPPTRDLLIGAARRRFPGVFAA